MPKIYAITDIQLSGLSHSEQVERLTRGGVGLVQLREKILSPRAFYEEAVAAIEIARARGALVIINDRVDIAIAAAADGVHLGQDDLPPVRARSLLGPRSIIGFSTHNLEQAIEADSLPVDYIGFGPVFATSTKDNPDPVVGLEAITRVKERIHKPLVAIGGITLQRGRSVLEAGADSVAVISDLLSRGDITRRARTFLDEVQRL